MKVLIRESDLSDEYVLFAHQLGADGFDIHNPNNVPGVEEQGYADAGRTRALLDRLRRRGLEVYRVAPLAPTRYLRGEAGGDREVEEMCRTLEALGRAGVPFMSMPVHLENPAHRGMVPGAYRGGYRMGGFDAQAMRRELAKQPLPERDMNAYFERVIRLYERLVPIAEAHEIKLITHPADPPLPESDISPHRWSQILDLVPSDHNGLLYCIGTRYESGVDIHADIRTFGRRGKIFHTHFRNVRGQIPTHGGYFETALDDGDMNMFRVLKSLRAIGFDGGLQLDHPPIYDGDNRYHGMAWGYAIGYAKALLRALEAEGGAPPGAMFRERRDTHER